MEKVVHGHLGIYLEAVERVACLVLASVREPMCVFLYVWESALMWGDLRGENVSSEGELGGKEAGW